MIATRISRPAASTKSALTRRPVRLDPGIFVFLLVVLLIVGAVHHAADQRFDFGVFYYAAHIVMDGSGASLYDFRVQHAFQARYHRPPEFLFYYPPFVLLPFLALARLPIQDAFLAWTALSIVLLAASVRSLSIRTGLRYDNWPLLFALAFMPVASNLANGQLSIVVLAAYVWSYSLWSDGRRFAGGLVLSLATFKFQLVAGFLCVLVFGRRWRELAGFTIGCVPLLVLSGFMVGIPELLHYPRFLVTAERGPGADPTAMASLRGFAALVAGDGNHLLFVVFASAAVLLLAASAWRDLDRGFSAAILASLLVGYHCNPQDLSLVLIPLGIANRLCAPKTLILVATTALALAMMVFATGGHFAVLAIPLAAALIWIRKSIPAPIYPGGPRGSPLHAPGSPGN
jgi:hypothetical protein